MLIHGVYYLCANHKFNPTTQLHGRNSEHFNSSCSLCKLEGAIIEFWAFEATLFVGKEFGKCTSKSMSHTTIFGLGSRIQDVEAEWVNLW